ncbi:hypothetical protein SR39_25870 [Methylobacterium radiotolerans]|nr:hypothetical protein SR39_25870 [Methylobacterium radiotolerans]
MLDMAPQAGGRLVGLAGLAQGQDLRVLPDRAGRVLGGRDLQPRRPLAILQERGHDRQGARPAGVPDQVEVEAAVQVAPAEDLAGLQRRAVLLREGVEIADVVGGQVRCRELEQLRLELNAQLEDVLDLLERQARHDRPAMRHDPHELAGLQLQQGFADRDAADPELLRQGVLAQLHPRRQIPVQDLLAQGIRDGRRHGLVPQPVGCGTSRARGGHQCLRRTVYMYTREPLARKTRVCPMPDCPE